MPAAHIRPRAGHGFRAALCAPASAVATRALSASDKVGGVDAHECLATIDRRWARAVKGSRPAPESGRFGSHVEAVRRDTVLASMGAAGPKRSSRPSRPGVATTTALRGVVAARRHRRGRRRCRRQSKSGPRGAIDPGLGSGAPRGHADGHRRRHRGGIGVNPGGACQPRDERPPSRLWQRNHLVLRECDVRNNLWPATAGVHVTASQGWAV